MRPQVNEDEEQLLFIKTAFHRKHVTLCALFRSRAADAHASGRVCSCYRQSSVLHARDHIFAHRGRQRPVPAVATQFCCQSSPINRGADVSIYVVQAAADYSAL